ncbi:hypothetical protein HAX54_034556, partial [Datura stramonium]|nr:hypothetical protein [Datura stramonium]
MVYKKLKVKTAEQESKDKDELVENSFRQEADMKEMEAESGNNSAELPRTINNYTVILAKITS